MASDSIVSFLDLAKAQRLLPADQVDELFDQPDVPHSDLAALCEFLRNRGILTRYQADMIRTGKASELNFAGYPILEEIGPCPGGMAYRGLHPSLRTPVVIRRLRTDWLAPADNAAAFVLRAQACCPITHPHIVPLLDAGAYRDEVFVVLEPDEGSNLDALVSDIGPMPANLAMEYGRQAALALQAVHDRYLVHGHVRPATLMVSPLVPMSKLRPDGTPRLRPAASARVRLGELGLEPFRPSLATGIVDPTAPVDPSAGYAYLPPERIQSPDRTQPGDIYGLGASLYFLLTGKPPYQTERVGELIDALQHREPPSLSGLRPDCPPSLLELIERMMCREPSRRPSASDVVAALTSSNTPPQNRQETSTLQPPPTHRQEIVVGPGPNVEVDLTEPAPQNLTATDAGPGAGNLPGQMPSLATLPVAAPQNLASAPQQSVPADAGWAALPYPNHLGYPMAGSYPMPAGPFPQPEPGPGYPPGSVPFPHPAAAAYPVAGYSPELYPGYPDGASPWNAAPAPPAAPDFLSSQSAESAFATQVGSGNQEKSRNWLIWVIVGAVLNLIAIAGWIYLFSGLGQSEPQKKPTVKQRR
jgi:serine/threonine protein kinase